MFMFSPGLLFPPLLHGLIPASLPRPYWGRRESRQLNALNLVRLHNRARGRA